MRESRRPPSFLEEWSPGEKSPGLFHFVFRYILSGIIGAYKIRIFVVTYRFECNEASLDWMIVKKYDKRISVYWFSLCVSA